jgi:hypothetical protein
MIHLPNIYAIINIVDLSNVDFAQIGETSDDTIRKNADSTEFVIKWYDKNEPSFITDGTVIPLQILTPSGCTSLMATPEWSKEPI